MANILTRLHYGLNMTTTGNTACSTCRSLKYLTIPSNIITLGSTTFAGCYSLQCVVVPTGTAVLPGGCFSSVTATKYLCLPRTITSIGGNDAIRGCQTLDKCTIMPYITSIAGTGATLQECHGITKVKMNPALTIMPNIFASMYKLKEIELPPNITEIPTSIFANDGSLTYIDIPQGITSLGQACFQACVSLTNVNMPSAINTLNPAGSQFYQCYSLKSITLSQGITSSILGLNAFSGCRSLSSDITIPSAVNILGNTAFDSCYSVCYITLPPNLTEIGNSCFINCRNLQYIDMPSSVRFLGTNAFNSCTQIKRVTMSPNITGIGDSTFSNCYVLSSIDIPLSATSIGANAFANCYACQTYNSYPPVPPTLANVNAFTGINTNSIIYVPSGSVAAYKAASNWNTFANYICAMP
jgi:hypothetical protein